MMQLVCASANPDKVAEIQQLLAGAVDLLPRPADVPDVVEDADTLVGNARLKAVAIMRGDRAAGRRRRHRVGGRRARRRARRLHRAVRRRGVQLRRQPDEDARRARRGRRTGAAAFKTVAMIVWPDGSELAVEGCVPGRDHRPRNVASVGFGYDAIFEPDEGDGRTFAEMGTDAKNELSHRGRAFRACSAQLAQR